MQKESLQEDEILNEKLDQMQSNLQALQQEVAKHAIELKYLDKEKRRKNLIVFGLKENDEETRSLTSDSDHAKCERFLPVRARFYQTIGQTSLNYT